MPAPGGMIAPSGDLGIAALPLFTVRCAEVALLPRVAALLVAARIKPA
jgi:hypothetical protein